MNRNNQIDEIFKLQEENKYNIASSSCGERIVKLKKIHEWILNNRDAICDAHYSDFKKSAAEVDLTEILPVLREVKYAKKNLKKWMKWRRVWPSLLFINTKSSIRYVPRGVVLIISPWNFPFMLTMCPIVSAIAAGNTVLLKPSELAPTTSNLISKMLEDLFPLNEVAVFEGSKETAIKLLEKPVDHIYFTGSSAVGRKIMESASRNLISITLELGGKSPVIIDSTADIEDAAEKIAWGKFLNAGQTCIAPDYILVDKKVEKLFLTKLVENIKKYFGNTEEERFQTTDFTRIINTDHFLRLKGLLDEVKNQGSNILIGGGDNNDASYIAPTVITDIPMDSALMREEIFGPILPVISFDELSDACSLAISKEKPLALYLFSKSRKNIKKLLRCTQSGGVSINEVLLQFLEIKLPFGGFNQSGIGNSHGFYGFKAFSHERSLLRSRGINLVKIFYPPYTQGIKKLIKKSVKYL